MSDNYVISRLNFVRVLIVLAIAIGYASTMPRGPESTEFLAHFGYEPSWIGIQILFFFSGFLALASLQRHQSAWRYLISKIIRTGPLLAVFTLATVLIIYPIFGVKTGGLGSTAKTLGLYFFETVSCLKPGRPLPGLLDDSQYMCLIQGAIWTFRWGLLAHIGAALAWRMGLLTRKPVIAVYAVLSLVTYVVALTYLVYTRNETLAVPLLGLRLAYPFLLGMAVYAYRDKLSTLMKNKMLILAGLAGFTSINALFLPWTGLIEVGLALTWAYAACLLAFSETPTLKWTENWPHLSLGFYLANWPSAQILLLLNPGFTPIQLVTTAIPLALSITVLTYCAIYGPTTTLINRKLGREIAV